MQQLLNFVNGRQLELHLGGLLRLRRFLRLQPLGLFLFDLPLLLSDLLEADDVTDLALALADLSEEELTRFEVTKKMFICRNDLSYNCTLIQSTLF